MSTPAIDDIPQGILNILESNWPALLSNGVFNPAIFKPTVFWTGTVTVAAGNVTFSLYRPAVADFLGNTSENILVCTYSLPSRGQRSAQDTWRVDEVVVVEVFIKATASTYANALIARTLMRNAVKQILHANETAIPYVQLAWVNREYAIEAPNLVSVKMWVNCLRYHPAGYRGAS